MAAGSGGAKRARPGGHQLRPEVIAHHQRRRILDGAAKVIAERGYRQVTVADIVRSAVIARARFYENFGSKQDCFLALYDEAVEEALGVVRDACSVEDAEFPERVQLGIEALVAHLEANPEVARACVVEGPAVGTEIGPRFEAMIAAFTEILRDGRDGAGVAELPESAEETVIGGLYWLLYYALLEKKKGGLRPLVGQLTEFSLIPFIGADAARTAIS
jgi:AcrR family transcriptional regulator